MTTLLLSIFLRVLRARNIIHFEHGYARQILKVLFRYDLLADPLLLGVLHDTITYLEILRLVCDVI